MTENVFREGHARAAAPGRCCFVLFGATGDLAARKLLPALYHLAREGLTPSEFFILGVARRAKTDEQFRAEMRQAIERFGRAEAVDEELWQSFAARLGYQAVEFGEAEHYQSLARRLTELDRDYSLGGNRLFYLAVAPEFFAPVTDGLAAAGLLDESRGWARVVVEKPFGTDLASAQALSAHLHRLLGESQIYRIDHYLGKETVQNLLTFRFGNAIFEPLWNRRYIEQVQITVAETVGMEGRRGAYYDSAGALRDMVQNHLMQLLALVAMEPPVAWDAEAIRDEKAKVMRALRPLSPEQVAERAVRARYTAGADSPAYLDEEGVAAGSTTETYVALRLALETWRWSGVPFYLRCGKRLPKRDTEIAIQFRHPPLSLFDEADQLGNTLVLRIQPDEGISLGFLAKVPGSRLRRRQVKMDFHYGSAFGVAVPEAYERLLLDAMIGDGTLFTREDEVLSAWRFIGSILDAWAAQPPETVADYPAGTWGPREAEAVLLPGHGWRRL